MLSSKDYATFTTEAGSPYVLNETRITPLAVGWAQAMGYGAMIFAALQYLPQLYTTFKAKTAGALSIPMMLIQTPGKNRMNLKSKLM